MATKLTLNIDEEVIKKAKQFSRKKGKSLSKIVEEYLNSISNRNQESSTDKIRAILKGKITNPQVNWKEAKAEYLKTKYDL